MVRPNAVIGGAVDRPVEAVDPEPRVEPHQPARRRVHADAAPPARARPRCTAAPRSAPPRRGRRCRPAPPRSAARSSRRTAAAPAERPDAASAPPTSRTGRLVEVGTNITVHRHPSCAPPPPDTDCTVSSPPDLDRSITRTASVNRARRRHRDWSVSVGEPRRQAPTAAATTTTSDERRRFTSTRLDQRDPPRSVDQLQL